MASVRLHTCSYSCKLVCLRFLRQPPPPHRLITINHSPPTPHLHTPPPVPSFSHLPISPWRRLSASCIFWTEEPTDVLSVPRCCGVVIKNSYVCVWNRSKFLFWFKHVFRWCFDINKLMSCVSRAFLSSCHPSDIISPPNLTVRSNTCTVSIKCGYDTNDTKHKTPTCCWS